MVAISLYKGNLHKISDVPRRWLMPSRKISLKDFKNLLERRSRALSRLNSAASNPSPYPDDAAPIDASNGNLDSEPELIRQDSVQAPDAEPNSDAKKDLKEEEEREDAVVEEEGEAKDKKLPDGGDCLEKPVEECDLSVQVKKENDEKVETEEKREAPGNGIVEASKNVLVDVDKLKRKSEVEQKLQILNEKKHSLVQVLKQILNAEEELKRRSSMQGTTGRPSFPLQVDVTNDSGSMTKLNTPRTGSDGNLGGNIEGREADDVSNQNVHSRHLLRMNSTSPSSDSQLRKPTSNVVPQATRTNQVVSGSPSRFAPTGHQGLTPNPPAVSVSGTNYIASSPSPAASGGTSVFRDNRAPSPWN